MILDLEQKISKNSNYFEIDNIEIHLPQQEKVQSQTLNQNSYLNFPEKTSYVMPNITAANSPTDKFNFLKQNWEVASSSEESVMDNESTKSTTKFEDSIYSRSHLQNQSCGYYHRQRSRHSSYFTTSFSRNGTTSIGAMSKPIDIRIPKSHALRNEIIEQTVSNFNSVSFLFQRLSPYNLTRISRKNEVQSNDFSEEENAKNVDRNFQRNFLLEHKQYNPRITFPSTRQTHFSQTQSVNKAIDLQNIHPDNEVECKTIPGEDIHDSDKENINSFKILKNNSAGCAKKSKNFTPMQCDEENVDDNISWNSCEENNSLSGDFAQKKKNYKTSWIVNSDGFPTPSFLYNIGDIIGYSKVVRAERNEALGQLNEVIANFSTEWPSIRSCWEHNLRIGQLTTVSFMTNRSQLKTPNQ